MNKWTKEIKGKFFILNNEFVPISKIPRDRIAKQEVIYEVIRLIKGKALFMEDHFGRLRLSFRLKSINLPYKIEFLEDSINSLARKEHFSAINIKILFILGEKKIDFLAYFLKSIYPSQNLYNMGVKTDFFSTERESPNIKMIKLPWREEIEGFISTNNLFEVILVNYKGFITEGSRSNLFFVKKGKLYTSPEKSVLPGITRKKIFRIAKKCKIKIIQKEIPLQSVKEFEAAFLTGTSPQVLPIRNIGEMKFKVNHQLLRSIMIKNDLLMKEYIKSKEKESGYKIKPDS